MRYYCERFGVGDIDIICSSKEWKLQADIDMDIRAGMIRELVMIRDGLWRFSWDVLYLRMFMHLLLVCV